VTPFERERDTLRTELLDLKRCQITYLTVALQATAIAFALAGALASRVDARATLSPPAQTVVAPGPTTPPLAQPTGGRKDLAVVGSVALLPLVIILPAWWVFFDKAVSVTRMASYLRITERAISGEDVRFIGWERAVERFRQEYARERSLLKKSAPNRWHKFFGLSVVRSFIHSLMGLVRSSTSRYWALVYCSFGGASLLCFGVGAFMSNNTLSRRAVTVLILALSLFLWTALFNLRQLTMLVGGLHSYKESEKRWGRIFNLGVDEVTNLSEE